MSEGVRRGLGGAARQRCRYARWSFHALLSAGLLASLTFDAGCARCSDEPRVPFKLNEQAASAPATPAEAGVAHPQRFVPPLDQPRLASGRTLALSGVRAALEVDLDADGDLDVLAIAAEADAPTLIAALAEGAQLTAPGPVLGFVAPSTGGCTWVEAGLRALSPSQALAELRLQCGPSGVGPSVSYSLLSLAAQPRVHERIDLLALPADQPQLSLVPRVFDADGDGHDDLSFELSAVGASDAAKLVWLDRPGGLVRDVREPEATFATWASAAQSLAHKAPEQAIAKAELALTLQRALCRELGTPHVSLSGTPGVPCGASPTTGQLLATLASAQARRNQPLAAFESYRQLRGLETRPDARALEQVQSGLQKLASEPDVRMRRGPRVEPLRSPRAHLPSARFISESLLYVQRARPVLYDLERNEESPAPGVGDPLLRDPRGELVATAVERTCDGYVIRIERAPPRGSDFVASRPVALALLAPLASGPGCVRNLSRPEDGGFTLLGWAPQGILAARGSELRLVPLAASGQVVGEARLLAPEAPRPAPLPAGSATTDAARYVEATPYGVLVYGPSSKHVELWRPDGYTQIASGPLEVAISPSARRVALVAGSDVYLLERAAAAQ